ncbi:MAG: deoxyguanosinetriphosphate triphosphohydrolase [Alphaproteobacteria bacterium]|nr:deoxyguanosinetriphosphate triphosphohydrolase [Alphaproteobacteria bacterium]
MLNPRRRRISQAHWRHGSSRFNAHLGYIGGIAARVEAVSVAQKSGPAAAGEGLAPYATHCARSRGRLHPEPDSAARTPFERDRDRIVHASAFRRLKGKTQVFVAHEGDHYRTRLTHSLEVAQIARAAAKRLRLDTDLTEACALAHDIGHPPFGHTGEDVLDECMHGFGGFDHNAQTLRVLTKLEERYPRFDGLNLTWETLEGVVKHNGPLVRANFTLKDLPAAIQEYDAHHDLELATWPGLEAQVAACADDIAYNNHDIDDGIRAGLFTLDEVRAEAPMVARVADTVEVDYPGLEPSRFIAETVRRLIGVWIDDLVWESSRRLEAAKPKSAEDVRAHAGALISFSETMFEGQAALRRFLMARMYRHWKVNRRRSHAKRIVREVFDVFINEPGTLPSDWHVQGDDPGGVRTARRICDYIAGMTDDYAIEEHRRLFAPGRLS